MILAAPTIGARDSRAPARATNSRSFGTIAMPAPRLFNAGPARLTKFNSSYASSFGSALTKVFDKESR